MQPSTVETLELYVAVVCETTRIMKKYIQFGQTSNIKRWGQKICELNKVGYKISFKQVYGNTPQTRQRIGPQSEHRGLVSYLPVKQQLGLYNDTLLRLHGGTCYVSVWPQ